MDTKETKPISTATPSTKARLTSKRAFIGWTALACVAISALAFFLVVQPQWTRVGPGRELDVDALQATLEEREGYLAQLKTLRSNYEQIPAEQILLLSRVLPTTKAVPELLTQFEAMGQQSGIDVTNINISEVTEARASAKQQLEQEVSGTAKQTAKNVKSLNIQVQISTKNYGRFKTFIQALQSNDRIMDVESYLFSTDQETQSVTVSTYYLGS